jgi:hypothetical protein
VLNQRSICRLYESPAKSISISYPAMPIFSPAHRTVTGRLQQDETAMTTLYAGIHPVPSESAVSRHGAAWRSWLRDIAVGTLVISALLGFGALPIALRFWFAMPELTRFTH